MKRWWLLAFAALVAVPAAGGASPAAHRLFVTPGGANGVSCEVVSSPAHGSFASCLIGSLQRPMQPPRAIATLFPSGETEICEGTACKEDARTERPMTLRIGKSVDAGPFRCTSHSDGVVCLVKSLKKGFFIGPTGVKEQRARGFRDSRPVWSADGRTIAFDRERSNRRPEEVVVAIGRDGRHEHRLIPTGAHDAAWSPDGRKIVYVDNRGRYLYENRSTGSEELWLMDSDTGERRRVSGNLSEGLRDERSAPVWSPDGRWFAVWVRGVVYVANADGRKFRQLEVADAFAWSPDGRQIAFRSAWRCGICVMDVATDKRRSLFPDEGLKGGIAWSPDGRRIVFSSDRDGKASAEGDRAGELYVANVDGSGVRRLTHYPDALAYDTDPIWSPDGRTILYQHQSRYHPSYHPTCPIPCGGFCCSAGYWNRELYAMNADGSNQRRLDAARYFNPTNVAWSPDGRTIALAKNGRIYLMDADGSNRRRLT